MEIKYNKEISLCNNVYLSFLVNIENPGILSLPPVATTHCLSITSPKKSDVLSRPGGSLYFCFEIRASDDLFPSWYSSNEKWIICVVVIAFHNNLKEQ